MSAGKEGALADRMDELAKTHPRGDDLREKAAALRDAVNGFWGEPQTITAKGFLGSWARARRVWSECSGEPLI